MSRLGKDRRQYYSVAGERCRQVMLEKKMSMYEVARKSEVSRGFLYKFFYDGTDISSVRLMKICIALDTSMDYVMGLKNGTDRKVN